jgi:small-conductance mechanosensitive channel
MFIGGVQAASSDVATLEGYLWDEAIDEPAQAYTIEIDGEFFLGNTTSTNSTGFYSINIPAGDFNLKITKNDLTYYSKEFSIERDEIKRLDFKIDSADIEEEEEDDAPFSMSFDQIVSNAIENWYAVLILIVLLIVVPIIFTVMSRFFEKLDTKKFKFVDKKSLNFIEIVLKYNLYLILVIVVLWLLALIFPDIDKNIWQDFSKHLPALYTILWLFIIMKLLLLILRRGVEYLRGDLSTKPKQVMAPRYITLIGILFKYTIIIIFVLNILIIALAIFGMGNIIYDSTVGFLSENSGYLIFIVLVFGAVYLITRFLKTFVEDMKRRDTTEVSPQIVDMAGKVSKILIYIMGAMLIIFALLQMVRMGELATTLIMMISIIIGFVVAMAATGSIGNILSGMVLNAFRPFSIGDRVRIGDTIGDVVNTNLGFVTVETLNSEIIEIPNNTVIADKIINFSKSGAFAVEVDISIGYNVPNELVKKLLIEAARETKDLEDDPRPYVILTDLGDYAVTYKLRAFTTNAKVMFRVRSNLLANIHTIFYSHGVEILSPWYLVRRDDKIPTDKQVADGWDEMDKKGKEVLEKKVEEKITDGFGLMDKAME